MWHCVQERKDQIWILGITAESFAATCLKLIMDTLLQTVCDIVYVCVSSLH